MSTFTDLYTLAKNWLKAPNVGSTNADRIFIQIGHILGGYAIALTAYHFYPHLWLGPILVNLWAIPKEFWYDLHYESTATRGSSLLDFLMYEVGLAAAMLVLR